MKDLSQELREVAEKLLANDHVQLVIGYGVEAGADVPSAIFIRSVGEVDRLVLNDDCLANLAVYLTKEEVMALGKPAIVVKGCDLRAVNVLLRENKIKREDVVLIGVCCDSVGQETDKCAHCAVHNPSGCDYTLGEEVQGGQEENGRFADVEEMDARSVAERWKFWREKLESCIRCSACRQVCPLCYCKRCIVEKSEPQWVETSAHLRGNFAWHAARAYHLTGRCVGCGECERVCPMGIPLTLANKKMSKFIKDTYEFESGMSPDEKSPFTTFQIEDSDDGIL